MKNTNQQLEPAIRKFVAHCDTMKETQWKEDGFTHAPAPTYNVTFSRKWAKITTTNSGVYAFVALCDFHTRELGEVFAGDIHRPASWSKPAKHRRGSVLDESTWDCAGPWGIAYLR